MTLLLLLLTVLALLFDGADAAKRRRRRKRRNRPEDLPIVRRGGRRTGARRLRHASSRREEFVRRKLRKFKNRSGDYEGKTRLTDGRAEFEGECRGWIVVVVGLGRRVQSLNCGSCGFEDECQGESK